MRKLKLFFACLLMAVLSIGQVWGAISTNSTWTATALADIPDGSTVIILNARGMAISNATVTKAPAKIEASYSTTTKKISVTTSGKSLDHIAWTTQNGTNGTKFWVYGSTTNLLGLTKLNDNNAVAVNVTSTAVYSEFVMGANGNLLEAMNGANRGGRFVGEYVSGSDWRSYNSEAANNYKSGSTVPALTFYVLDAAPSTPTVSLNPSSLDLDAENVANQSVTITTSNFASAISSVTTGLYSDAECATPITSGAWVKDITVNAAKTAVTFNVDDNETGAARECWLKVSATDGTGNASEAVHIAQKKIVVDYATLPFEFTGGRADIENTDGMTQNGLGTDYSATEKLKFDGTGDWLKIKINADPGKLSYQIKGNSFSGGTFTIQQSADDETYSDLATYTADGSVELALAKTTRYVKFIYTSKSSGNIGLGNIAISLPVDVEAPNISGEDNFYSTTTVTLTQADADAIYYTTDGSTPTTSSTKYTDPFVLDATATVKAIAIKDEVASAVAEKTFTKATVMTVAQALAATPATDKYVAGVVASVTEVSTEHGNATYTLKDAGEENSIIIYRGKYLNNVAFTSVDQIEEGDEVTVFGEIKKYSEVNQFTTGNYIVAMYPKARLAWSGTTAGVFEASLEGGNTFPTLTNSNSVTVEYSSSNTDAATINASTGEISLVGVGSTTITASFAGNPSFKANSVSYTLNVSSSVIKADISFECNGATSCPETMLAQSNLPSPLPTITKAGKNFDGWWTTSTFEEGTEAVAGAAVESTDDITLYAKWLDPYTVAEAKTVIDANPDGIANQYVTGVISQIDSYNNTYHSITYWISADGTTTNQLQVYSGLIGNAATALGKEDFSAKEDLELGDEVVVTGTLKLHNSTIYEFDKNNTIYTFSRKESAGLEYAVSVVEKTVVDDAFINELTNPNSVAVTYESSDEQVAEVANDGTVTIVGEGSATITASFAGNAQYKAAEVSYTLTVSATVDTRHIANSPATFTTVSGDMTPNDITFAANQGGAGTAPGIYNSGIRLYQAPSASAIGGYITLTAKAGCTIDEVQITTTNTYATTVTYSVDGNETLLKSESVAKSSSYTTGTGLNVQSVNIVNKGTSSSGRLEIASIKVYYTGEPASIHHYVLGGTYQTAFMQGDEFNHTGLIVYAAYDELEETKVDITSMCTFSDPDMNTTGDKTIEITYNEAVVTSYTINVAADSRKVANSPATFTTVSGDMTPNDITFASYQGGAGTAPQNYNDGIRLYQAPSGDAIGGFITLKAKKGCTIDQVKITTTNTYATTVAYSVDGNENLLGSESVAKSSDYTTPSGLNVESVNIVNKGTGSSGRLEIASIKVWYTGDALAVHHYILGGTYETVFEQFGTFSYEGLTVTAAYDELETITEAVTGFTVEADLSTAGAAKANVMLNSVKIAEYDITVNASAKTDPALAYDPTSVILTLGNALSAPTLSNTYNVSPISYESSKPAVATVDAEGNITLAGGTGVAVITASFAGDDNYIESEATFTITVNEPTEDLSGTWVKATSVVAGDRIIIGATVSAGTKTMGLQNTNNRAAVASTYEDLVLTPADGTKTFLVVDAGDGKFALQALNGKYLTSATSGTGNNLLEAANYENDNAKWTITIDGEGVASVVAAAGNRTYMKYNNGSTLFSCYQYETSQSPINIYKKGTPDYGSYQRTVTNGNYGTICLPKAGVISGATLFEIADYDGSMIYVDEILNGEMEAGKPYIFQATSEQLNVTYTSSTVEENAGHANGLYGFYNLENENAQFDITQDAGNYILYSNQYWLVSGRAAYINNFRAYIKLSQINNTGAQAPGRRRVAMAVNGEQTATGVDALNAAEAPVKMMINGQMYILRGEKMYDATGRLVK